MSSYGYIKHSELSHHGIKGQKWGIRRYQNSDGSLTAEGRERYLVVGKKYEKLNRRGYRNPKTRADAISIIKYDRDKSQKNGNTVSSGFNIGNHTEQSIVHFPDKNGIIALSYSRVPGHGDIYVKGPGNINDLNLNNLFKKPPRKIED